MPGSFERTIRSRVIPPRLTRTPRGPLDRLDCPLIAPTHLPNRPPGHPLLPDMGRPLLQNLTIVEVAVAGLGVTLAISPEATTSRLAGRTAVR